ncbi:MAG: Maf family protein [Anaerolineae bacterium]|nr:Maf family protein [Anaerolineae bacterium]
MALDGLRKPLYYFVFPPFNCYFVRENKREYNRGTCERVIARDRRRRRNLLILASGSPRRKELLAKLGLRFQIRCPDVDETNGEAETPPMLARRLSLSKAMAAAHCGEPEIVIAADTLVALEGEVLGKPRDARHAVEMLTRLRGRMHLVYSGLTMLDVGQNRVIDEIVETPVWMRAYSDEEIAAYVATGDPIDKAGAYAIQHPSFTPVERIKGCYANVMGLPLCHVYRGLAAMNELPPVHPLGNCHQAVAQGCPWAAGILGARPVVTTGNFLE